MDVIIRVSWCLYKRQWTEIQRFEGCIYRIVGLHSGKIEMERRGGGGSSGSSSGDGEDVYHLPVIAWLRGVGAKGVGDTHTRIIPSSSRRP